jgi:hypothetical protein
MTTKSEIFLNHKEKNYTFKLPTALLFEFETERDARAFNDAIMTLLWFQSGDAPVRSSLVNMKASEIYAQELV